MARHRNRTVKSQEIIAFLKKPRTTLEIAKHFGFASSSCVTARTRKLENEGLIVCLERGKGKKCTTLISKAEMVAEREAKKLVKKEESVANDIVYAALKKISEGLDDLQQFFEEEITAKQKLRQIEELIERRAA